MHIGYRFVMEHVRSHDGAQDQEKASMSPGPWPKPFPCVHTWWGLSLVAWIRGARLGGVWERDHDDYYAFNWFVVRVQSNFEYIALCFLENVPSPMIWVVACILGHIFVLHACTGTPHNIIAAYASICTVANTCPFPFCAATWLLSVAMPPFHSHPCVWRETQIGVPDPNPSSE